MTLGIRSLGYDGRPFSAFGVAGGFAEGPQAGPPVHPIALERAGREPLYAGSVQGLRVVTLDFVVDPGTTNAADVGHRIQQLLGHLRPGDPDERTLVVQLADGPRAGLELEAPAACGQYRYLHSRNGVSVDFFVRGDWRRRTEWWVPFARLTSAVAIPLVNIAPGVAYPRFQLQEHIARTGHAATVGWRRRRLHTVTNNTTRNWWRVRYTLDLGDTAAWVSGGLARADGHDIRIVVNGQMLPRTLTNVNTARTFAHIEIDLPAGASQLIEVWYGNPSATAPPNLSTRTGTDATYAADDLEGIAGTATGGTSTTLTTGVTMAAERWRGGFLHILSGAGAGQRRRIASNTGPGVITVERAFTTTPTSTSVYAIWRSGVAVDGGAATVAGTTTTLTDGSQEWGANKWRDGWLWNITQGTGPFRIASNTATVITTATTMPSAPASGNVYAIERYGVLQYHVDRTVVSTAHRGLWRLNRYHNRGGRVAYGDQTPGGWSPALMLPNNDDLAQGRFVDEGAGGGHAINNWPALFARRGTRSANVWPEKGQADGVLFMDPRGLNGFDWDYRLKNEGGIGMVEVRSQEPGGSDWQTVASDSQTLASLTDVTSGGATGYRDLGGDGAPVSLWAGVLPVDGVEIPGSVPKHRSIELRPHTRCRVWLAIDGIGGLTDGVPRLGAEESFWDAQPTLRLGGGSTRTPPFQEVLIGGPGRSLAIRPDRTFRINSEPAASTPLFGIYLFDALQVHAPWAGRIMRHEIGTDGLPVAQVAGELLPLHTINNMMGVSANSPTGWTVVNSSGVASSLSAVTGSGYDGSGQALRVTLTTLPAGSWTVTLHLATPAPITPGEFYEFAFAARRTDLTSGVTVTMTVEWHDGINPIDTQTAARTLTWADRWLTNGGGQRTGIGPPQGEGIFSIYGPAIQARPRIEIAGSGSTLGHVSLQVFLALNGFNLYVSEPQIGTVDIQPIWRERWIG